MPLVPAYSKSARGSDRPSIHLPSSDWPPPPAPPPTVSAPRPSPPPPAPPPPPAAPPPPPFSFGADPGYAAALSAERTGRANIESSLRQRRLEALIGFGDVDLAAQSGFGLTPAELEAVRSMDGSGNATLAKLKKRRDVRRQALINRLAGRGMLFSGSLGYGEREGESEYAQERFAEQQAVLARLREEQDQSLTQQQSLRDAVTQALQQAYQGLSH